jgi:hypothetical protein
MQQFHKFYYLTFMCRSTCFGRLHAHHQELITALTACGFTVGALVVAALLVVVWPVNRPEPEAVNPYPANVEKMVSS